MNGRLLASFLASATLLFAGTSALGAAIAAPHFKVIATVVAHAHTPATRSSASHGL